ncbi:hypothetical protein HY025_00740 [Candidatus Daviesbacteria bacterium]|nr:hypothetical protein [Candidatus Daviesbacteria bacterium]
MTNEDKKLKKLWEQISKGATQIVGDPESIQKLLDKGIIKKKFISYEEYAEKIFVERKKNAVKLLSKLPLIDESIADSVITDIYEEIRSSYAFGIFTSTIFNSIILLEYTLRSRLYSELLKTDSITDWTKLEKLTMGQLIIEVSKLDIIPKEDMEKLKNFNKNIRNPYLHINIQRLTEGIQYSGKLPGVDVNTQEIREMQNVKAKDHRFLWFSAKRFFDKALVQGIIDFCIDWTNKLLDNK